MTTAIVAFERDMTAHVVHHLFTKCRIDSRLPEAQYNQAVYSALAALGSQLSRLGVKIDAWGIDGSGVPYEAVTLFAKNAARVCGIHACAFLGRASHVFNPLVRSRLRDAVNRTVLCGDAAEHVKSGAGKKYIFWDSDFYRQNV